MKTGLFYTTDTLTPEYCAHYAGTLVELERQRLTSEIQRTLAESLADGRAYIVKILPMTHASALYEVYTVSAFCVLHSCDDAEFGDYVGLYDAPPYPETSPNVHPYVTKDQRCFDFEMAHFFLQRQIYITLKRIR